MAVGLAAGDIILLALVARKERFMPDFMPSRLRVALRGSPRLMVQQFGYVGQYRFGTLALGVFAAPLAVAEYTLASRLAEGLVIVSIAIAATSYPVMVQALRSHGSAAVLERLVPAYWMAIGVSASAVFVLVLAVPLWLLLVFPKYPGAAVPFALVGLSVVAIFASAQTTAALNTLRRDSAAAAAATLGLGSNVFGVLLLGGSMGAVGVAFSRLIGEVLRMAAEVLADEERGPTQIAAGMVCLAGLRSPDCGCRTGHGLRLGYKSGHRFRPAGRGRDSCGYPRTVASSPSNLGLVTIGALGKVHQVRRGMIENDTA